MIRRQLRVYGRWVAAIAFLAALAAVAGAYILVHQRLQTPLDRRYTVYADLPTSSGLAPGLGEAVNVAGVRVGQIAGAKLVDGVARLALEIDPGKLPRVYDNATAALIPNTPLKDMLVELGPGGPPGHPLRSGGVIGVAHTDPPIDSDELTGALDADTRDFFDALVGDGARGLAGRGQDLNRLLHALRPTTRQVRTIADLLAARRHAVRRLVGNLALLTQAAGARDADLARVVSAANATLQAVAGQDGAVQASLDRLPGTLADVRRALPDVTAFANDLGPTLTSLQGTERALTPALTALRPTVTAAVPVLRTRLRPLVRDLRPLARDLRPTVTHLVRVTPDLSTAGRVLTYVTNELAYNPPGDYEGFLFWLAWFAHDADSMLSVEDAHGAVWRGMALLQCSSLTAQPPPLGQLFDSLFGATAACKSK
jgi:phospholipid/cholesterol/gamma-HCH transport system substrate-binding protein